MKFLMRTPTTILLSIAIICATIAMASAASYSSFWTLGDSLSDPGNLYKLTGGTEPVSPPYYQGRFSNGPVWAVIHGEIADLVRTQVPPVPIPVPAALLPVPAALLLVALAGLGLVGRGGSRSRVAA